MNREKPLSEAERREAAAAWLARLEGEASTEADWLAFEAWLGNAANKAALADVEAVLAQAEDNADAIRAALREAEAGETIIPLRPRAKARPARRVWIAAAGLGLVAAAAFFIAPRLAPPALQELAYAAPKDRPLVVTLPDSSTASLNRGAAIKVLWNKQGRRVVIDGGEVAFTVKHDAAHPFVVTSGEDTITDLGTEFNVLRRGTSLIVTVRQGSVQVATPGSAPLTVAAGREYRLDHATHLARLSQVNPEDAFAWQVGRLVYKDATLAAVVEDLNRYGDLPIRLATPDIGALRFSGVLMIERSQDMVSQLQSFLPVSSEQGKEEIVLRGR